MGKLNRKQVEVFTNDMIEAGDTCDQDVVDLRDTCLSLMDDASFADAVAVARGCLDYSGGHRGPELEIYHHGVQTVINALWAVQSKGWDMQSKTLKAIGEMER